MVQRGQETDSHSSHETKRSGGCIEAAWNFNQDRKPPDLHLPKPILVICKVPRDKISCSNPANKFVASLLVGHTSWKPKESADVTGK